MKLVFILSVAILVVFTLCVKSSAADTALVEDAAVAKDQEVHTLKEDELSTNKSKRFVESLSRHKRDICDGRTKAGLSSLCAKYKPGGGHVLCIQFCRTEGCGGGYCANKTTCYCNSGDNY